jgi:uroporphyrin-III C-methyltransferase
MSVAPSSVDRHAAGDASPMPRVHFVGAGPGDPELLTLKAARLLQQAEVVLHDALIDPRVLALASHARCVDVGKRSNRLSASQRFINRLLVSAARRHACVVRLKGGDPAVFGRLDEEMRALDAARIRFEVVPGITAASAAAASLKASLTLRGIARSVRFVTPRTAPGEAAAGALQARPGETLAIYMGGELLTGLAQRLRDDGLAAATPLVAVENASLPTERLWAGTLGSASQWPGVRDGGPVLLLVGDALAGVLDRAADDAARQGDRVEAA